MSLSHSFIIVFGTIVFLTILVFLYFTKNRQLLIDVRTNEEWRKNGQRGSTNIPYNQIHTLNVDKHNVNNDKQLRKSQVAEEPSDCRLP